MIQLDKVKIKLKFNTIFEDIEKKVFYINIGDINDVNINEYIKNVANSFKTGVILDHKTGQINAIYNSLTFEKDYYL